MTPVINWWSTYNAVISAMVADRGRSHSMDRMHVLSVEAAERAHGFIPDNVGDPDTLRVEAQEKSK